MTDRDRVRAFIRERGPATTREIEDAFRWRSKRVRATLAAMRQEGRLIGILRDRRIVNYLPGSPELMESVA